MVRSNGYLVWTFNAIIGMGRDAGHSRGRPTRCDTHHILAYISQNVERHSDYILSYQDALFDVKTKQ